MPELPEVETIRRELEPIVRDGRIVRVWHRPGPAWSPAARAKGHRVLGLGRRGKFLIWELEGPRGGERDLLVHLGMTGNLLVEPGERRRRPDPHVHAAFGLDSGLRVSFRDVRKFGRIVATPRGRHEVIPAFGYLGPEPFSDDFDPERFAADLERPGAPVKARLLSQRIVAGVGNIYADEACHLAEIDPRRRSLRREESLRLHAAIRTVLQQAIASQGTTFRDYRRADGGLGEGSVNLKVYGRGGEPCLRCGSTLASTRISGRSTVFCPLCQPERRPGSGR